MPAEDPVEFITIFPLNSFPVEPYARLIASDPELSRVKLPLKTSGFELPRIISPSAVLNISTLALNVFPPSLASERELFFVNEAMLLNVAPFKNKRGLSKVTSHLKIVTDAKI
jgi:hypothetical protein